MPLPDVKGRCEILKVHAKKVKMGPEANLERVARGTPMFSGADLAAIINEAALAATMASIRNHQRICLANKETMVAAGELINLELSRTNAELIPIDSEQSAIFQSLGANKRDYLRRIILTASGGPFLNTEKQEFSRIRKEQGLKAAIAWRDARFADGD